MSDDHHRDVMHIKKYPNRRYYDTTRSRHVTLQEVHDTILSGKDVFITDSRTGDDITNVVLTQILLEKDPPKLDVFPTSMFLMMIRSNRQVLRTFFEPIFGPFLGLFTSSQRQFDQYLRQAFSGKMNPLEWAGEMMKTFRPNANGSVAAASESLRDDHDEWLPPADDVPTDPPAELDELRQQVAALTRKIEGMGSRADTEGRTASK